MRNKKIIIESILSYIALIYCGPKIIEGENLWLNNFTESFKGFGFTGMILPVFLMITYYFIDKKIKNNITDRKFINYTAIIFAIFMGIGRYYQYKIISLDNCFILYFQIMMVPLLILGFYYVLLRALKLLLYFIDFKLAYTNTNSIKQYIFDKHYVFFTTIILTICYLPYFLAFFPASISYDGSYQIGQYLGEFIRTDHHPPFVTYFYGYFADLYQRTNKEIFLFMVVLIQFFILVMAISLLFKLLKKCHIDYKIRIYILLFYALFTIFPIYTVTIIKDSIYYPLTLIYTVLLIYGILFSDDVLTNYKFYILLIFTLLLLAITRNNGIYIIILSFPLFILASKKYRFRLTISLIFILASYFGINQYFYNNGVIKLNFKIDKYTVMLQQTARYGFEHQDAVTEEEYIVLDEIFEYWRLPYEYNSRNADYAKRCLRTNESNGKYVLEERMSDYLKIWLNQFLRYPVTYFSAFIESSYGYYYPDIKEAYEGLGWYNSINSAPISFKFSIGDQSENQRSFLEMIAYFLRDFPIVGILYSCGFYAWVVFGVTIYFACYKKWKQVIYILPSLVNILVCCVSPISGYIRYALPVISTAPLIFTMLYWNRLTFDKK